LIKDGSSWSTVIIWIVLWRVNSLTSTAMSPDALHSAGELVLLRLAEIVMSKPITAPLKLLWMSRTQHLFLSYRPENHSHSCPAK
jgi:hypothetical protein